MARIGWTKCGVCGNSEASVSENGAGTLSVKCHKCQYSGFAKAGTKSARIIRADLAPDDDAPEVTTPKAAPVAVKPETKKATPKEEQKAPPKVATSVFDLGAL